MLIFPSHERQNGVKEATKTLFPNHARRGKRFHHENQPEEKWVEGSDEEEKGFSLLIFY